MSYLLNCFSFFENWIWFLKKDNVITFKIKIFLNAYFELKHSTVMQLCSGKKKSVSCLGAASQHDYESIVPLQNDTFSSWKGVYWRHNFCWFPQAKRKEAVWFCFIAYCIVFDASNIMRDELHNYYTSLSNLIKWVFSCFLESI